LLNINTFAQQLGELELTAGHKLGS